MQGKFTPGQWRITELDCDETPLAVDGHEFRPCLVMGDGKNNRGTALANARLIASAPSLLEACKETLAYMEDCLFDKQQRGLPSRQAYETIRAAIALATEGA